MGKLPKYFNIDEKSSKIIEDKLRRIGSERDETTIAEIINAYIVGYSYGKYFSEDSLK